MKKITYKTTFHYHIENYQTCNEEIYKDIYIYMYVIFACLSIYTYIYPDVLLYTELAKLISNTLQKEQNIEQSLLMLYLCFLSL